MADKTSPALGASLVDLYQSMVDREFKEVPLSIREHLREIDRLRAIAPSRAFSRGLSRKIRKALDRGWRITKIEVSAADVEEMGLPNKGTFRGISFEAGETTQLHLEPNI